MSVFRKTMYIICALINTSSIHYFGLMTSLGTKVIAVVDVEHTKLQCVPTKVVFFNKTGKNIYYDPQQSWTASSRLFLQFFFLTAQNFTQATNSRTHPNLHVPSTQ